MNRASIPSLAAFLIILLAAALAVPSYAMVDILSPAPATVTNSTTLTFDYYVSLPQLQGCVVNINNQQFPDADAQSNAMNSVQVQNLVPGTFAWNVTCTNGTVETSETRLFTIDTTIPTLVIVAPQAGITAKQVALDIIPADETAVLLACDVSWNNQSLETISVARNTHYTKNYTVPPGNGTLQVKCADGAGNTVLQERSLTIIPDFSLRLTMDKTEYGLGEQARLTIDTISGANVSVDICPDQAGFVQCTSALIVSQEFPQTVTLPYINRTGPYLVDGTASYGGQTRVNRTSYSIINTMSLSIELSTTPQHNKTFNMTASVGGGIAPYRFVWQLSDGTQQTGTVVGMRHAVAGNYTQRLTAYDVMNNTRTVNITYIVKPVRSVIFRVFDNQTGEGLKDVEIDITNSKTDEHVKTRTLTGGLAYVDLEEEVYRVFITAPYYEYFIEEYLIDGSGTIPVGLARSQDKAPQVTITAPAADSTVSSPLAMQFKVVHDKPSTCTLLLGADGDWFSANGTTQATSAGEFVRSLSPGQHRMKIECTDGKRTGSSPIISFTVGDPQAQVANTGADEERLQEYVDAYDSIITNLAGYGQKEKDAIAMLGFDRQLRNTKKSVQQAIRDVSDLQFRNDLDSAARKAERERILESVEKIVATTPVSIKVTDSKTYVKYLDEPSLQEAAAALAGIDGFMADSKRLAKLLTPDQQKFTISTRLMQVETVFPDQTAKTVTIISRSFTYAADLPADYRIYEVIPKEVIASAKDIDMKTKGEIVVDDPIISFGQEETITYIIPRRVDFTRMEDIKTVLARTYAGQTNSITGFAILSGDDIAGMPLWLIGLVAFILTAYLVYYFDIFKQAKYLIYRLGRNEKSHYVRVLIGDVKDQLAANDYDKAELVYREIRMTYDSLPIPAKNELYEDVIDLVHEMDGFYFNMVMIELDGYVKTNDLENAIASYEKLTRIYERLDPERQQQLVQAVTGMARRLGMEAMA
jgi:hypothetical protein